ncbi:hypothetical protein EDB19DRAFT_1777474 [Suillus lakei]|nr:hypothetical protein EDB19DRAFT_1777474 [Suillus lakei]
MSTTNEAWVFDNAKACVSQIEEEMNLGHSTLQKCITIICNEMIFDADEDSDVLYIDVHFQYYLRSRFASVQWFYLLGFKIHRCPSVMAGDASVIKKELRKAHPPGMHTHNGWQIYAGVTMMTPPDTKLGAPLSVEKWSYTRRQFWTFTKRYLESHARSTDDHLSGAYTCSSPLSAFHMTLRVLMLKVTNRRVI